MFRGAIDYSCTKALLGSYLDDIIQNDPGSMKRVRKGLDEFLERDRDRELFDLVPKEAPK